MRDETVVPYYGKLVSVRDLSTGELVGLLFGAGAMDTLMAVVRELLTRPAQPGYHSPPAMNPRIRARMNQIDPPACACGRPGLYIVGVETYCRRCRPGAVRARTAYSAVLDAQNIEKSAEIEAVRRRRDRFIALRHKEHARRDPKR